MADRLPWLRGLAIGAMPDGYAVRSVTLHDDHYRVEFSHVCPTWLCILLDRELVDHLKVPDDVVAEWLSLEFAALFSDHEKKFHRTASE